MRSWARRQWRKRRAASILATAAGTLALAYLTLAVQDAAPRLWDLGKDPITVRVETDPREIWSDLPARWVELNYVFRQQRPQALGRPPFLCHHRRDWARARGGIDARRTFARVEIEGRDEDHTVVIDGFDLVVERRQRPLRGTQAACPAGGAQAAIRKFRLDLDGSVGCFTNRDGVCVGGTPRFTLAKGEIEFFDIEAFTKLCLCTWFAQLRYHVGDEEHVKEIKDNGKPFQTSATSNARTYSHTRRGWRRGVRF